MSYFVKGNTLVMSSFGNNTYKDKTTFWKKNNKHVPGSIRPVYGAQHPPRQEKPSSPPSTPTRRDPRGKPRDSFQDFQAKTNDAWDDGDDDLILMANIKMSLKDVHSTAMEVINKHSQQKAQQNEGEFDERHEDMSMSEVQHSPDPSTNSAHHTPSHMHSGSQHVSGPGVGVRLNNCPGPRSQPLKFGHMPVLDREASKAEKFKALLEAPISLELNELRTLSWSGIPRQYRPIAWKILAGYLPASFDRRDLTLQRKRHEYFNFIDQYYDTRHQELHQDTFRQIHIDIPRMSPLIPLFQQKVVQEMFERILFIWAIRHPASGYVQGINDLVTPYFIVFLAEYVDQDQELDHCEVGSLGDSQRRTIEADSFWCFSKLMDSIQDNYTFAQPGIQQKVNALKDLVSRIDNDLHQHLAGQNVEYLQFAFRWMNNLLMRELPLRCTIRLWDTYLSEVEFAHFHLYVCAALLTKFSQDLLREKDFHGLMLMLQNLPTDHWQNEEIDLLLAEAYRLKYMFADAPNHLAPKK